MPSFKCICLSVLPVVASLLLIGLSGATRKDTAGNLRHHSSTSPLREYAFFQSCHFSFSFSFFLLLLRIFQWKTILEWNLQVNVERGWRNQKEASSLLPIIQTNTHQTQSVFTSLKVITLFKRSRSAKCNMIQQLLKGIHGYPEGGNRVVIVYQTVDGRFRLVLFILGGDDWSISSDNTINKSML